MDYANRGRPPRKKKPSGTAKGKARNTKRGAASKSVAARPVPWLIVILALVLVGLFTWFLVSINGKSEESEKTLPNLTKQPVTDADKLPTKPEERWQYIEELENKEVYVDVPERELGPPKLMQCGSFRSLDDAQALRARMAMVGLEAIVRASEGTTEANRGTWHRVILGPYETKRDAERDRHKLQRAQIFGCQIWNWNLGEL